MRAGGEGEGEREREREGGEDTQRCQPYNAVEFVLLLRVFFLPIARLGGWSTLTRLRCTTLTVEAVLFAGAASLTLMNPTNGR